MLFWLKYFFWISMHPLPTKCWMISFQSICCSRLVSILKTIQEDPYGLHFKNKFFKIHLLLVYGLQASGLREQCILLAGPQATRCQSNFKSPLKRQKSISPLKRQKIYIGDSKQWLYTWSLLHRVRAISIQEPMEFAEDCWRLLRMLQENSIY